jgi:hypothetical protein
LACTVNTCVADPLAVIDDDTGVRVDCVAFAVAGETVKLAPVPPLPELENVPSLVANVTGPSAL